MRNQKTYNEAYANFMQTSASLEVKKGFIINSFLIGLFIVIPFSVNGQTEKLSEIIIEVAEELAADNDDPEAITTFIDRLNELAENPVRINSSGEEELSRLFFLSDFQVKALADYAHSSGRIVSVYELAAIPGFDRETVQMIIPFITLENNHANGPDSVRLRNTIISNFSYRSGNYDTSCLGSAWKILTKYRFVAGGFSGGVTMEKDPGEKLLTGNPPLPDFLSAHIAFNGRGVIRKIIIGDFSARFGQGTNINTGIRRGISLTSPGYMSSSDDIKPYTSTEENKFFRGVAAELSVKNIELSMFFSKNYTDATLASSSDSVNDYIENFYTAGVHNTPSLMQKKDNISQLSYGVAISCNLNNLKAGLIWSETRFSLPVTPDMKDPGKTFDFTGDRSNLYTVYYNSLIKNILLYGELSVNNKKKYAVIQGISFRPSDRLTINFLFRNYSPGYKTFYGNGPGSGSATANETGILGNFAFEAARHLFISGGCDLQYFPWLKYRCSAPSWGLKKEIKVRFIPSEKMIFDASYNYRLSLADNDETQGIPGQEKVITRGFKIAARYSIHDNLTLGARADYKIVDPSGSRGIGLFQEINYSFRRIPLTLWARYCFFNTDDWASRIYTYENDLLYSFSIPALYGEGSRSYLMLKWKPGDFAEFRVKYGITSSAITGKSQTNTDEFKIQFRLWFTPSQSTYNPVF